MAVTSAVANNSGRQAVSPYANNTLTGAATVTPDLSVADCWEIQAAATTFAITVANPVNVPGAGVELVVIIKQGATSASTVTWGAAFAGAPAISATLGGRSAWVFRYDGTNWLCVGSTATGY